MWFPCLSLFPRNESDRLACSFSAGDTEIRGYFRVADYCFSILFAACEPAGTSMCMRKHIHNLFYARVYLDGKLLCSKGKADTEYDADTSKEE